MLKTSWVTDNYQVWLRGDDVDIVKVSSSYTTHCLSNFLLERRTTSFTHIFGSGALSVWDLGYYATNTNKQPLSDQRRYLSQESRASGQGNPFTLLW